MKKRFEPFRGVKTLASHVAVIAAAAHVSEGPILELGAGAYSTPILHWLAALNHRSVLTLESDPAWFAVMSCYRCSWHEMLLVPEPSANDALASPWGMAFVDNGKDDRLPCLKRLHHVPFVVAHDTDPHWHHLYKLSDELARFRYRLDCDVKPFGNMTTIVSETVDVSAVFGRCIP